MLQEALAIHIVSQDPSPIFLHKNLLLPKKLRSRTQNPFQGVTQHHDNGGAIASGLVATPLSLFNHCFALSLFHTTPLTIKTTTATARTYPWWLLKNLSHTFRVSKWSAREYKSYARICRCFYTVVTGKTNSGTDDQNIDSFSDENRLCKYSNGTEYVTAEQTCQSILQSIIESVVILS